MSRAPIPDNESERIAKLFAIDILDTSPEGVYDDLTKAASLALNMPISLISLVDTNRQWFKSKVGLDIDETSRDIAFCSHAVYSNEPLIVEDAKEDERFKNNPFVTSHQIRSYLGMPLNIADDMCLGTLCVISPEKKQFSSEELELLGHLRDAIVRILKYREESLSDYLTGVFNRRMFHKIGKKFISTYKRDHQKFCLISIDIDNFKTINDRYGHDFGDNVLITVCKKIEGILREDDYLFRLGGEEFAVLAPSKNKDISFQLAERICKEIEKFDLTYNGQYINPTISCGVCDFDNDHINIQALLNAADDALYKAKSSGKNKVLSV